MPTSLKQKLAIAAAAMAGLGAGTLGITSAFASPSKPAVAIQTPAPQSTASGPDTATESTEAPGAAEASKADPANEPGVVGTGHADPAGQNVDNQFQGAQ